jgi:hypothetical protein
VLVVHHDGYIEVVAPRGAIRVAVVPLPRVYHHANERLARALAFERAPGWVRRFLNSLESRVVATASASECADALELAWQKLALDLIGELRRSGREDLKHG